MGVVHGLFKPTRCVRIKYDVVELSDSGSKKELGHQGKARVLERRYKNMSYVASKFLFRTCYKGELENT